MRIAILLITTLSLFDIISCSANSSFSIQSSSEESYSSLFIAENPDSLSNNNSKITLFQKLNLTAIQQEKIEQIHRLYYPKISQIREQLTTAKEELTDMMAGATSATAIRTKHQEILNLRQKLGEVQLETMLATREVLTVEQRQNFADILRSKR